MSEDWTKRIFVDVPQGGAPPPGAEALDSEFLSAMQDAVISKLNESEGDLRYPKKADLADAADAAKGSALVGHAPSGAGAAPRTVSSRLNDTVYVTDHIPNSELAAIRAGTSTFDAFNSINAARAAARARGAECRFPAGRYAAGKSFLVLSGERLRGEGPGTVVENLRTNANTEHHKVFRVGEHHPLAFLQTNPAAQIYAPHATAALAANGDRATLSSAGAGANFSAGEVVFVADSVQEVSGANAIPRTNYMARVVSVSGDTLVFDRPVPLAIASPLVYKVTGTHIIGAAYSEPWHVAVGALVDGFRLVGRAGVAPGAMYGSRVSNIWAEGCANGLVGNGVGGGSVIENYSSDFDVRAVELKTGSCDAVVRNLRLHHVARGGTQFGPVSLGERAFGLTLEDVDILLGAGYTAASDLVDIVDGFGHRLNRWRVSLTASGGAGRAIFVRGSSVAAKLGEHSFVDFESDWRPATNRNFQVALGTSGATLQPTGIVIDRARIKGQRNTATGILYGTSRVKVVASQFEGAASWQLNSGAAAPEEALNSYSVAW